MAKALLALLAKGPRVSIDVGPEGAKWEKVPEEARAVLRVMAAELIKAGSAEEA